MANYSLPFRTIRLGHPDAVKVKKIYNSNVLGRIEMTAIFVAYFATKELFEDVLRFKNPVQGYIEYKNNRGMSKFYDWKD